MSSFAQKACLRLSDVLAHEENVPYLSHTPIRQTAKALCFRLPRQCPNGIVLSDCWLPASVLVEAVNDCGASDERGQRIYLIPSWLQAQKMEEGFLFSLP